MRRLQAHAVIALLLAALLAVAWLQAQPEREPFDELTARGTLVVGTRYGPTTYYETRQGAHGLEQALVRRFAEALGLAVEFRPVAEIATLLAMLERGEIDMAAGGLGKRPGDAERFAYSRPYMTVEPRVVYANGGDRPTGIGELAGRRLLVVSDSLHEARLRAAAEPYPGVRWESLPRASSDDLLYRLTSGQADAVVTDSNELTVNQHFYPEVRSAFTLGEPYGLRWAFRPGQDSLRARADAFLDRFEASGKLASLFERYHGHLRRFDYVGTRRFIRDVTRVLPRYRSAFQEAAAEHDLDWRLLAAIGYQESHWDPEAVSPTGVRGVMMLTLSTAAQVGIEDRLEPAQSIIGGARYLSSLLERLPESIAEPHRTWFALAAYNVGLGHLEDARVLTERQGGDPDSWFDVRERLPLLAQERYYSTLRYGYARGAEPVAYVARIRRYYELLRRITEPRITEGPGVEAPLPLDRLLFDDGLQSAF
ncbi:membrane-bound lytic murein transglycosylase MltF [Sediminicurvatus halobius]|uniref:Membrane-bound lytic murein transglycosylase F n=1 Tax=Sediminicurvatus halobius TaxID=2182432 RepID=A0A2U2N4Z4_9GAMM|nr:membrane-bound lytic murein transglycosylase MltF [Spiribacter halobius]PWG64275.1 membrane-bound lytic murein transglycosylase MltF [Spiribacter halobius]UEX79387.1 membrane-bound lytic murein transglycosylase MltF [Spiribacter halobius]